MSVRFLSFLFACSIATTLFSHSVSAQNISTFAGNGTATTAGDGGAATSAGIDNPREAVIDASGNTYVSQGNKVRKIDAAGNISTIAGTGAAGFAGDGGQATAAQLNTPYGLAMDAAGNLYIADCTNQRVRKVTPAGIISTVAGTGVGGYSGDGGAATLAQLWTPNYLSIDNSGNIYITDNQNQRIRKLTPSGIISTVVGSGVGGYSGDGGQATAARINYPAGTTVDNAGNLYVCDNENAVIRKVTPAGIISTIAGTGTAGYGGDGGAASAALFRNPLDVIADASGNLYIADRNNARIRKINSSGIISTVAGTGVAGFSGDGGLANAAKINGPDAVVFDNTGAVLILDNVNNRIRRFSAGNSDPFFTGGTSRNLLVCESETVIMIDTLLPVADADLGQTLTWSLSSAPAHGVVSGSYSTTSTGGVVTPAGYSYTPASGYAGTDMFQFTVTDGIASDVITINVTISPLPNAGIISGRDSVCPGDTVHLSETVAGGIWSYSNAANTSITFTGIVTGIAPGHDTVIYTVINACGIVSAIFPFTVRSYTACHTGVNDIAGNAANAVYPNPSAGSFEVFISSAAGAQVPVRISDITGRQLKIFMVEANKPAQVALDCAAGIYLLEAVTEQGRWSTKLVITR